MIGIIKNKVRYNNHVKGFVLLGMDKKAALIIVNHVLNLSKLSGSSGTEKDTTLNVVKQIVASGWAYKEDINVLAHGCPMMIRQIKAYYGYSNRSLMRHAENKRIPSDKLIYAIINAPKRLTKKN